MNLNRSLHQVRQKLETLLLKEKEQWTLWFPVTIGIGIILYFCLPTEPSFWLGFIALFLIFLIWCFIPRCFFGSYLILSIGLGVALGFFSAQLRTYSLSTFMLNSPTTPHDIEGTIYQVEEASSGTRVSLKDVRVKDLPLPLQNIRLTLRGRLSKTNPPLYPGQQIIVRAVLLPPNEPIVPGGYNYRQKAYFLSISAVGYAIAVPRPRLDNFSPSYDLKLAYLRHWITILLRDKLGGLEGAIAAGLVTGDRAGIPQHIRQAFADSGLAHILAISGLHLSIITGLVFLFVRRGLSLLPFIILRYNVKKWAAVGSFIFVFFYLLVSGMAVPAQRAFIMTSIVLFGILIDRSALTLRNVALSASAILLIIPEALLSPSFQLSFAAVTALVAGYETLQQPFLKWQIKRGAVLKRFLVYLGGICLSTVIATLATTPYIIYTFNRFTLHAIPANLISIPLLSFIIMPLLIVFMILYPLGLEEWIVAPLKWGLYSMVKVSLEVSSWPGAVVPVSAMSGTELASFTLGALWLCLWKTRWRRGGWIGIIGCVLLRTISNPPDFYIHPEKKLIAFSDKHGGLWVNSLRSGRFNRETYAKVTAASTVKKFDQLLKDSSQDILSLTKEGYVFHTSNGDVLLQPIKNLLYSPQEWKLIHSATQQILDYNHLREKGVSTIWVTSQGFILSTVAESIGKRPWSLRRIPE
jgi:competence protein ComEC